MTENFGFFLIEDFSMMSVAAAIEPLRAANRHLGKTAYAWHYYSLDGEAVHASNGMKVDVHSALSDAPIMDRLFVSAGLTTDTPERSRINASLQRASKSGINIGALSGGTFLLARAGLIGERRCTAHWEFLPSLREAFPALHVEETLFVNDDKLLTCSGGAASMEMMLHLISMKHGEEAARFAGNQFQHDRLREGGESQRGGRTNRITHLPDQMQLAMKLMQDNIEQPLTIADLSKRCGIHTRRLERLFSLWLKTTPKAYYQAQRLECAHDMLLHSNNRLADISQMTGFSSQPSFSTAYRKQYGETPRQTRMSAR